MLPWKHADDIYYFPHIAGKEYTCIAINSSKAIAINIRYLMFVDNGDTLNGCFKFLLLDYNHQFEFSHMVRGAILIATTMLATNMIGALLAV